MTDIYPKPTGWCLTIPKMDQQNFSIPKGVHRDITDGDFKLSYSETDLVTCLIKSEFSPMPLTLADTTVSRLFDTHVVDGP